MNLDADVEVVAAQLQKLILQLPREKVVAASEPSAAKSIVSRAPPEQEPAAFHTELLLLQEQSRVLVETKAHRKAQLESVVSALERRIAHLVPPGPLLSVQSVEWDVLAKSCIHSALNFKKTLVRIEHQLQQHGLCLTGPSGEQQKRHRLSVELTSLRSREARLRLSAVELAEAAGLEWTAASTLASEGRGKEDATRRDDDIARTAEALQTLTTRRAALDEFQRRLLRLAGGRR
jgi:hypothetical protein